MLLQTAVFLKKKYVKKFGGIKKLSTFAAVFIAKFIEFLNKQTDVFTTRRVFIKKSEFGLII